MEEKILVVDAEKGIVNAIAYALMMPKMSGLEVCKNMDNKKDLGIILLTVKNGGHWENADCRAAKVDGKIYFISTERNLVAYNIISQQSKPAYLLTSEDVSRDFLNVDNELKYLNGMRIGDKIDKFTEKFGEAVSSGSGDMHFKYEDVFLSVNYDVSTGKTNALYILKKDF
jgi:hypothetical protein